MVLQTRKEKTQKQEQKQQKNMEFRIDVSFKRIPYALVNVHLQAKYL